MPMKITAEMTCAYCHEIIRVKGKPWRFRRSSGVLFPDLYTFEDYGDAAPDRVEIIKGYRFVNGDEAESVLCSERCVLGTIAKTLPKMRMAVND